VDENVTDMRATTWLQLWRLQLNIVAAASALPGKITVFVSILGDTVFKDNLSTDTKML